MKRYLIIVVLLLFFGIFFAVGTLGLFETSANMLVTANLANWSIKINNIGAENISTSFNVNNFVVTTNDNVASNLFAPGSSAYFDIDLDASNTQVSVMYDITFDFSNITNSAIVIDEIEEVNGNDFSQIGFNTYAGIIPLSDMANNASRTFRVYLVWNDEVNNGENDYNLGNATNRTLSIPVSIHAIQYADQSQNTWMNSKLGHIINSAILYGTDNFTDDEDPAESESITVNSLITPINYLKTIEKDSNDNLTYYDGSGTTELKTLALDVYEDNDEIFACIIQNASNQILLGEDALYSVYTSLGYYC